MNIKDNQQPKGLRELMRNKKEDPFEPYMREAIFPREILQPIYEKWKREHAADGRLLADEFYQYLLRQSK